MSATTWGLTSDFHQADAAVLHILLSLALILRTFQYPPISISSFAPDSVLTRHIFKVNTARAKPIVYVEITFNETILRLQSTRSK